MVGIIAAPAVPDIPAHGRTGARTELRQSGLLRSGELVFGSKVGLGVSDRKSVPLFGRKLVEIMLPVQSLVV